MSFRPMPLDFDVKEFSSFLYFRSRLLTVQQSGAESIQFVVQSYELIYEIVFHAALAARWHIVKPHDYWMHDVHAGFSVVSCELH
jgi:hypothetical protein